MGRKPKTSTPEPQSSSPYLKGGEFKRSADEANERATPKPSLSETEWADPPKEQEKRQRG